MLDTPHAEPRDVTVASNDSFKVYGQTFASRLLLGTARYPSPDVLARAVKASGAGIVTTSLRREQAGRDGSRFFDLLAELDVTMLPNTAGCRSVREAVTTAHMARELFDTPWIKLELIANDDTLQPDVFQLVEAARILVAEGFEVFPYTTDDLSVADRLVEAGCEVLMPWGAPIGTGRGLANPYALRTMRTYFPDTPLIVDAGIGRPSHAAQAMELGYDAIMLNTAVALADMPEDMARAFALAIDAGRLAARAGMMDERDMAVPSTPVAGTPFFDFDGG
ncbi:MAG: thiazole synthase [Pseudomonadota bacterium]